MPIKGSVYLSEEASACPLPTDIVKTKEVQERNCSKTILILFISCGGIIYWHVSALQEENFIIPDLQKGNRQVNLVHIHSWYTTVSSCLASYSSQNIFTHLV